MLLIENWIVEVRHQQQTENTALKKSFLKQKFSTKKNASTQISLFVIDVSNRMVGKRLSE